MIELKGIYELDTNNIIGFYIDGHIDKQLFLEAVIANLEDYLEDDEIEDYKTPKLENIEHIWYRKITQSDDEDFDDYYSDHYFLYSSKEKDGYSIMTKYEL